MRKQLMSLDFGGVTRLVNIPTPTNDGDVTSKSYVLAQIQSAIAGLDYQSDVAGIQTDATLAPTLTNGSRYIVTNVAALNASFGAISGVENGDIVQYNGSAFVVACDVSVHGSGILCFNRGDNQFYKYTSGTWSYGGFAAVAPGTALENVSGTFNVLFDNISIGVDANGKLEIKDKAINKSKLGTDIASDGLEQNEDGSLKVKIADSSLSVDAAGLKLSATLLKKVTATIGDGSATSIDVPHSLATKALQVSVYDNTTDNEVDCGVHRATDKVTLTFDTAPATGTIDVVIIG
ncbi:hypothetical protein ACJDU8_17100 [Clostridium sp. WILCCON 0269]|uniref:Uncharacterized protein n=1 Tax=Candidatus Clostridium eludens TaxID=3381663 RepID=A0ABW8SN95_9CLOT